MFGPTKTGTIRTLELSAETLDLHNRADSLGLPLQVNTIGERQFAPLIKKAGVKRIKFHGCATPSQR